MSHIAIISGSIRNGRNSHRVATYFHNYINENKLGTSEILDLKEYHFPLFDERLKFQKEPLASAIDFADRFKKADGIILVTPEYNGGYPASVKNAVDLLTDEWKGKPIAIATVSAGDFGGSQVITSLTFSLWKIRAKVVTAMFPVPRVQDNYDEQGVPKDKTSSDKRAASFIHELFLTMEQAVNK
ncbi:MAG: putative flavoprotein [Bacteroidetes bacterium]|jgi:NAD(P)H-dependent FMN reductase|nr:putative flavoprotein [Bacteroidota bacterium]